MNLSRFRIVLCNTFQSGPEVGLRQKHNPATIASIAKNEVMDCDGLQTLEMAVFWCLCGMTLFAAQMIIICSEIIIIMIIMIQLVIICSEQIMRNKRNSAKDSFNLTWRLGLAIHFLYHPMTFFLNNLFMHVQ